MNTEYSDQNDFINQLLHTAVRRKVQTISIAPRPTHYEISWRRGTRTDQVTIMEIGKDFGREVVADVCLRSKITPANAAKPSNDLRFTNPLVMETNENFLTVWSAFAMQTNFGISLTLGCIYPTPFEAWEDFGLTANQSSQIRSVFEGEGGGVFCFSNIYHEQTAQAISRLTVKELIKHQRNHPLLHVAEMFYDTTSKNERLQINPGDIGRFFDETRHAFYNAVVFEPPLKNYIGTGIEEFFDRADTTRLVVINNSAVDFKGALLDAKTLPDNELEKLRAIIHIEELYERCFLHETGELFQSFDLQHISCESCNDTGTADLSFKAVMLKITPEIRRNLEELTYREFMTIAETKNWFIK